MSEFKNALAFLFKLVLEENYSKLIIITKQDIFDLFQNIFQPHADEEYYITFNSKLTTPSTDQVSVEKVFYYLTDTINRIKQKIVDGSLKVQVACLWNNFPFDSRYNDDPNFIKLAKSFDDCTIIYIVKTLHSKAKEYKVISDDLRMFDDFNSERQSVLSFFIELHELTHIKDDCPPFTRLAPRFNPAGLKNELKFRIITNGFVNTVTDPFFASNIVPVTYKPNQICGLIPACTRPPYENLHTYLENYYFFPDKSLNHILRTSARANPSGYKAFFNIRKDQLLAMYAKFGFSTREAFRAEFDSSPLIPSQPKRGPIPAKPGKPAIDYYYEKYLKYKSKYLTLKNKLL